MAPQFFSSKANECEIHNFHFFLITKGSFYKTFSRLQHNADILYRALLYKRYIKYASHCILKPTPVSASLVAIEPSVESKGKLGFQRSKDSDTVNIALPADKDI
jgi:hypothetical protein